MSEAEKVAAIAKGISTLAPDTPKKARNGVMPIVDKIVRQIAHQHLGQDVLYHVYCAGLWHGLQLAERVEGGQS